MTVKIGNFDKYKYNPDDFASILFMQEELDCFYDLLGIYKNNPNSDNRFALEKQSRDLFFTIKCRKAEGNLTAVFAEELLSYMEELLYD